MDMKHPAPDLTHDSRDERIHRPRRLGIAVLCGLFLTLIVWQCADWSRRSNKTLMETNEALTETKVRGAMIVAALNAFYANCGCYPNQLADLVPKYLPGIPKATWGEGRWTYTTSPGEGPHHQGDPGLTFELSVRKDFGDDYLSTNKSGSWRMVKF